MNFAKKIFLGSVIAMGAFGLVACGDDSSTNASDKKNAGKVELPVENAANISSEGLTSRVSGDTIRFTGRIQLDFTDETNENSSELYFKSIDYEVMNSVQTKIEANVLRNDLAPATTEINLGSNMSVFPRIYLLDPAFAACDDYSLVVKVVASDGVSDFSSALVIPFNEEAKTDFFCKSVEPASSSSEPVLNEIVMTSCIVDISTANDEGINLATCTAVPAATADIAFAKSVSRGESDVTANAGAGITFVSLLNEDYGNNMWPEDVNNRPAYLSDFKMGTSEKTSLTTLIENGESLSYVARTATYDAATGAGIYPFAVYDSGFPDKNGFYTFKVKIYKVQ